jgi:hypothetical protein
MDKQFNRLTWALIIGLALSEVDQIFYWLCPAVSITPSQHLYLDNAYNIPITPVYYVYELSDNVNKMIWALVLAIVAIKINYKFYLIACVFLFFRFIQIPFYIINRNSSFLNNIFVYAAMAVMIFVWVKPFHKPARIIKM